jgi:branched-chain amino acid transport system substrate-binding protein
VKPTAVDLRKRWRLATFGVAVIAASSVLAGCGSSATGAGGSGSGSGSKDYLLGVTTDLSGPLASYGKWQQEAWTGYFNGINKAGGIDGHQVKLEFLDDQSVASTAVGNARQLISAGALLIGGSVSATPCTALAPIAAQAKVPLLCSAASTSQLSPVEPYVFTTIVTAPTAAGAAAQLIPQLVSTATPKVAIVTTSDAATVQFGTDVAASAQAKNWSVVSNTALATSPTADVVGPSSKIAAEKPDIVAGNFLVPQAVSMVRDLRTDGSKVPLVLAVPDYTSLMELKDPGYYQLWPNALVDPTSSQPAVRQLVSDLASVKVTGAAEINAGRLLGYYLSATLVGDALKKCGGSCTSASLAAAMSNTSVNLPGLTNGTYGYTPTNHQPVHEFSAYVYDATTGAPKLVAPSLSGTG